MAVRSIPLTSTRQADPAQSGVALGVVVVAIILFAAGFIPLGKPANAAAGQPTPALAQTSAPAIVIIHDGQPDNNRAGRAGDLAPTAAPSNPEPDNGVAQVVAPPTWQPEAPEPAGSAEEAAPPSDPAAEAQATRDASIPAGAELHQDPGGSYYQVPGSQVKYDIDAAGHVVNVRLPGSEPFTSGDETPPEQKVFLDPNNPADAAYIATAQAAAQAVPTVAHACASRAGCK